MQRPEKINETSEASLMQRWGKRLTRRSFLFAGASVAAAALVARRPLPGAESFLAGDAPEFETDAAKLKSVYRSALNCLERNITKLFDFHDPVLIEGSVYRGVWLECAPQEGLVYSAFQPEVGLANHRIFFDSQREDGYLPCNVKLDSRGTGQIQMVVPIASTAYELFERFGDAQFLETAYRSCSRWDAWLRRYRNTRATGLCEGFCEFDTGHDNSPRWRGVPKQCPDKDARIAPKLPGLPRLCPDLSATVYSGRVALAKMARALGRQSEADRWEESAAAIRKLILERLYDLKDCCFYDLDAENRFVRVRGDLLTRVLGEHVVDQETFELIYRKQVHNPKAFWALYPLPSIALDDPAFVRPIPRNSWGGASQALTALRAPRWMEHYGKPADLAHMMQQWMKAILMSESFRQQMDPLTGEFTLADPNGYSPAALVFLDYVWRLHGVRRSGENLEWNCSRPENCSHAAFSIKTPRGTALLRHAEKESELTLAGKTILKVKGTVRVITDKHGRVTEIVGVDEKTVSVHLPWPHGKNQVVDVAPNSTVQVSSHVTARTYETAERLGLA